MWTYVWKISSHRVVYFLKFLQYTNDLQFSLTAQCVVIKSVNRQSNTSVKFCSPKNSWQACCYGAVSPGTCLASFSIRYIDNNELKNRTQKTQNREIWIDKWTKVAFPSSYSSPFFFFLFLAFNYLICDPENPNAHWRYSCLTVKWAGHLKVVYLMGDCGDDSL